MHVSGSVLEAFRYATSFSCREKWEEGLVLRTCGDWRWLHLSSIYRHWGIPRYFLIHFLSQTMMHWASQIPSWPAVLPLWQSHKDLLDGGVWDSNFSKVGMGGQTKYWLECDNICLVDYATGGDGFFLGKWLLLGVSGKVLIAIGTYEERWR